jgi:hypothetical protein
MVATFAEEFPGITPEAIARQVQDAREAVDLFGVDTGREELMDRLVREHLRALAAMRSEVQAPEE